MALRLRVPARPTSSLPRHQGRRRFGPLAGPPCQAQRQGQVFQSPHLYVFFIDESHQQEIWQIWRRAIGRRRSTLSGYGTGTFPLPTISPPLQPRSRSRRVQQRFHRAAAVTRLANSCVDSLNALSCSLSRRNLFRTSSNSFQRIRTRLLLHIYRASMRFVSRQDSSLCDDTSSSWPMLSSQLLQSDLPVPDIGYSDIHSAVPLIASKVSLPSVAGTSRLLDLLPPHLAGVYAEPSLLLRPIPARCRARP